MKRPVAITGVGLASSQGEGRSAHAALLKGAAPVLDEVRFAPYPVHPLAPLPFDTTIPRREMRQMETWQRLGVYAAGLALDDAGLRDRVAEVDLIVAAGGGERDTALDEQILAVRPDEAGRHRMLMDGLRPTLFLAQLSNLLAGSISIVHNVAGSSRTLLGEEIAGAEAIRVQAARIAAGTSELGLVGGAFAGERFDQLLLYAFGGALQAGPWQPLPGRPGMVFGSAAAFLTLEPATTAASPLAVLSHIATDQGPAAGRPDRLAALFAGLPERSPGCLTISTACGAPGPTRDELAALGTTPDLFTADLVGHAVEAAFPMGLALGALAIAAGAPQVLVTGTGQWRGEAVALLEKPA
ncbi:beta-ketoacyl-ACP synthase [Roseococcus pinisoli]|uniref:Beta-ketoacyl-ACP synthase n=1 Tax=Roseococcus pinisoli TaxID=2835040 RepID=A0ABS5QD99_9PROT|nr:beta-ketoacyl-ACP synthase [Roseococcus pinisoli]MBS7811453.1 beta-ketoacyl-ACP synthase [Roseococcus pinisoli]